MTDRPIRKRIPKGSPESRSSVLSLAVSEQDREQVMAAAAARDLSTSEYLRAVLKHAQVNDSFLDDMTASIHLAELIAKAPGQVGDRFMHDELDRLEGGRKD